MIVYGHRGAAGEAPENTIAGALHAVERGIRRLEIDLHLSKDHQLVVIHDDRLKRTAGVRGKVAEYSAAELARLDARASGPPWPSKRNTGVPTLTALVEALPQIRHWQLELKAGSWPEAFPRHADEAFNGYAVARYVNAIAQAGKEILPLPMSVNVWLRERKSWQRPGDDGVSRVRAA